MNRPQILIAIFACLLALAALTTGLAYAATSSGYDLSWWSVDGGSGSSNAASSYSLGGSIGQPDAGTLNGTGYSLAGGFWGGVGSAAPTPPTHTLYFPLLLR